MIMKVRLFRTASLNNNERNACTIVVLASYSECSIWFSMLSPLFLLRFWRGMSEVCYRWRGTIKILICLCPVEKTINSFVGTRTLMWSVARLVFTESLLIVQTYVAFSLMQYCVTLYFSFMHIFLRELLLCNVVSSHVHLWQCAITCACVSVHARVWQCVITYACVSLHARVWQCVITCACVSLHVRIWQYVIHHMRVCDCT